MSSGGSFRGFLGLKENNKVDHFTLNDDTCEFQDS
jgi:hypothetical protein